MGELRVIVDGTPLAEDAAREFWRRFSEWMEEHVGDLAGFAVAEGLASVKPELHGGRPVLIASRTAAQVPYGAAMKKPEAGGPSQPTKGRPSSGPPKAKRSGKRRHGR